MESMTETAAPVSTRAKTSAPSMVIRMTFAGEGGGLGQIDDGAVLASGTAAPSFPLQEARGADASAKVNGVAGMGDGWWCPASWRAESSR